MFHCTVSVYDIEDHAIYLCTINERTHLLTEVLRCSYAGDQLLSIPLPKSIYTLH